MKKGKTLLKTITAPALIPGQLLLYDEEVTFRNLRSYIPFRAMHVVNTNTTINVEIMFDYSPTKTIVCLSNGIKDIKDQPFRAFSIKNTHGVNTLAAGDVIIELETY